MLIPNKHSGYAKDGTRLYPIDGGGSSTPSATSQTINQTSIPEYAKPYVENMLGKTEALGSTPYQAYGQERQAGFTPLQQQAQQGAGNMQVSGQTGFASGMAGAAGLGALGAQYDPTQFQSGQFGQQQAQQYMSPYMQSVVDVQQQEAQRQADIAGTTRNAQATTAGAFGGSRQAITDAEAARNLATQKGSIQATGLQNAYQQAQSQYNTDQARQLQAQQATEQSKQYGAGYGMQGLQTALQGAGQLGALGQQDYTQQMGINQLQQQTGATQQAQQQAAMTQQYNDFLAQKQYPYQQLSYMSDMLRGLPMSQSTQNLFQAPGSISGQIAGLGTGAIGAAKLMGAKEGGLLDSYAEGGVTSEQNIVSILDGLSDQQLGQAKQNAVASNDKQRVDAIDEELAQRASMRSGLASIPMDYESMMPDQAVGKANGGIVAFAEGGDPMGTGASEITDVERKPQGTSSFSKALSRFTGTPEWKIESEDAKALAASAPKPPASKPAEPEKVAAKEPEIKAAIKKETSPAAISQAVSSIAEEAGVPKQTMMEQYDEIKKKFTANNQATTDILKAAEEKQGKESGDIKARGIGEVLANFGFAMAAAAAKPGSQGGLRGLVGAAASASPTIATTMAENQKLQSASDATLTKMQIDRAKYEQAMEKGDSASAAALMAQIRLGESQAATLQEQIKHNRATEALTGQQLAQTGSYYADAKTPEMMKIANALRAENPKLSLEEALGQASSLKNPRADVANLAAYDTAKKNIEALFKTDLLMETTPAEKAKVQATKDRQLAEAGQRYGVGGGGGSTVASNVIKVDNQGNIIK
jgi:hypothetical protein